ncbi:MAG TPA: dephospho-CoA kinase [Magnetospirillaceae bacterium]|nr:dephospho-CoA kinase [Magnetospirillaceae bacterium]
MKVIGLTGSIGMGKTTVAQLFRRHGVPVYDADRAVHGLSARGGRAVPAIARVFPGVVIDGAVDRKKLGALVFGDDEALKRLEAILHPLVAEQRQAFLRRMRARRKAAVVLDIPLLFETGNDALADLIVVVSAPAFLQTARVMKRPGMSAEKLAGILSHQMPDGEKRRRADLVVRTGGGKRAALRQIDRLLIKLKKD